MAQRKIGNSNAYGYVGVERGRANNPSQAFKMLINRATGQINAVLEDAHEEAARILLKLLDDMVDENRGGRSIADDYITGEFTYGDRVNPANYVAKEKLDSFSMVTFVESNRVGDLGYRFHILNKGRGSGVNKNKGIVVLRQIATGTTTPNSLVISPPTIIKPNPGKNGQPGRFVLRPGRPIAGFEARNFYEAIQDEIKKYIKTKYGQDTLNLIKVIAENG